MNDNPIYTMTEARNAYKKFIRISKGPLGIRFFEKKTELKNFIDIQREVQAYNSVYLGMKYVNIDEIVGSVQKYTDFDKNFVPTNSIIEARWCNIYIAFMSGASLPLVQLYKIRDEYYVYDGNHRISVANFLNFKNIEAEVTEFLPSSHKKEDIIYREKFLFQKQTDIEGIEFSEIHQYRRINKEIKDFQKYLKVKEDKKVSPKEAAKIWYESLYKPATDILASNNILDYFRNRTISDVFIYFLDHKYYKSEAVMANVGFTFALVDFINRMKTHADKSLNNRFILPEELKRDFYEIKNLEKRMELDREIIVKLDILKEVTNINFHHNFVILYEIDDYFEENNFNSYTEAVESWYKEKLLNYIDELKQRLKTLPEKYAEYSDEVLCNEEMLFYQFRNYEKVYEKKYKKKIKDLIPNYIIDVYIPIVDIVIEDIISTNANENIYSGIYGKYLYLFEYNRNVTLRRAADLYIKDKGLRHYKMNDWFGIGYNNVGKLGEIIDIALEKMDNSMAVFFKTLIVQYGKPSKYNTLFKLEEIYKQFLKEYSDETIVQNKLNDDLKKIFNQNEINIFYKTKAVLLEIQKKEKLSFLDFYVSIMSYTSYIGNEKIYLDIIDLTLDYINR